MADEPPFISPPFRESTSDFVRRIASEPRPTLGPPIDSDGSDEVERAEDMAEEWRWGYIHGYWHGWSDKTAGRQYGEDRYGDGRNLRKPEAIIVNADGPVS